MEIVWYTEGGSPYRGDLRDITQAQWDQVTHVWVQFSDNALEWVPFKGLDDRGYLLKIVPSSPGFPTVCPEDVWGLRFK